MLIYVGAVMVFMVYVIMLLDVRDRSFAHRYSWLLVPGVVGLARRSLAMLAHGLWTGARLPRRGRRAPSACSAFAVAFLNDYWLHFELVSVLLVVAVVAALAVIEVGGRHAWISCSCWSRWRAALFALGLLGVIVRRNVLVMLMCMELMLNAVNLSLVVFAQHGDAAAASVLVFLVFVVAAAEIAIAIPIVLLLVRHKRSLDLGTYTELRRMNAVKTSLLTLIVLLPLAGFVLNGLARQPARQALRDRRRLRAADRRLRGRGEVLRRPARRGRRAAGRGRLHLARGGRRAPSRSRSTSTASPP